MGNIVLPVSPRLSQPLLMPVRHDDFSAVTGPSTAVSTPSDGLDPWALDATNGGINGLVTMVAGEATVGYGTQLFADDFARTDGAVGNGWTVTGGFAIAGDKVVSSAAATMSHSTSAPPDLIKFHLQNTGTGTTKILVAGGYYFLIAANGGISAHEPDGTDLTTFGTTYLYGGYNLSGDLATGVDLFIDCHGALCEGSPAASDRVLSFYAGTPNVSSVEIDASDAGQTISDLSCYLRDASSAGILTPPATAKAVGVQFGYKLLDRISFYIGDYDSSGNAINGNGITVVLTPDGPSFDLQIIPGWLDSTHVVMSTAPASGTVRAMLERHNLNVYFNDVLSGTFLNCPPGLFTKVEVILRGSTSYKYNDPVDEHISDFQLLGYDTPFLPTFEDAF